MANIEGTSPFSPYRSDGKLVHPFQAPFRSSLVDAAAVWLHMCGYRGNATNWSSHSPGISQYVYYLQVGD